MSREHPSELWSTLIHDTHRDCVNIWTNIAADAPLTLTRALRPHEDEGINCECLDGYYQKVPLAWLSLTRSLKHTDADRGSVFFSHGTNSHVPPVTVQDPLGVAINPTPTKTDASDRMWEDFSLTRTHTHTSMHAHRPAELSETTATRVNQQRLDLKGHNFN